MFVRFSRISLVLLLLVLIKSIICDQECDFKCEENGICLTESMLCNGIEDCLHGSDESFVLCKYPNDIQKPYVFICANGAEIDIAKKCNMKVDCVDKSDESVMICDEFSDKINKTIKGAACRDGEMMCSTEQCISRNKMCDGNVDCLNGRDESVELCMEPCDSPNFQCANGKCISGDQVCNNVFDCIDGSDELSIACEDRTEWKRISPVKCKEPTDKGLRFSDETKFYSNNESRFVYANGPVHFKCFDPNGNFSGNEWNVCMITGKWRHDLPKCHTKWKNEDPDTNGINGCKIDTYSKYKDRLRIGKCVNESDEYCTTQQVQPPINDMGVKFFCDGGYSLYPETMVNKKFDCWNKSFPSYLGDVNPRCVKKCNSKFLYCRDSMVPICKASNEKVIPCKNEKDREDLPPLLHWFGTTATFLCKTGFRSDEFGLSLVCQEDGTWRNSSNMDNFCTLDCGQPNKEGLSRGGHVISPLISPWSVAIYWLNKTVHEMKHICGGVLIRHNLVLTAAHCVCAVNTKVMYVPQMFRVGPSTSNISIISGDFGWSVKEIKISRYYHPLNFESDTALIIIEYNKNIIFTVICLPWLNNDNMPKIKNGDEGEVCSWDTGDIMDNGALNLKMVLAKVSHVSEQSIRLQPMFNQKICKGDSGSGFISDGFSVKENKTLKLVYGIVSSTGHGFDVRDGCTNDVTIVNTEHSSNREFIQQTLDEISNTCDLI